MTDYDDQDATRAHPQYGTPAGGGSPYGTQPYGAQPWQQEPQQQQPWQQPQQQPWPGQPQQAQPWEQQPQQQWPVQPQQQWQGQPWEQQGAAPLVPPTQKSKRGKAVGAAAAAVILIGGGIGTYVAVSGSSSGGGSSSPKAAVQKLVGDLDDSDLIGVLNDLPPGERSAVVDPFTRQINQLKRNDVLASNADPAKVSGVDVSAKQLTYGDKTVTINDHVQIVQVTGGTLTVNADALKLPLTDDVLNQIKANSSDTSQTKTYDLSDYNRTNGHPLRVAAQKVDGHWYPSLAYTIADNAATSQHLQAPAQSDSIPADGASSADEAVRTAIEDLLRGDVRGAIAVTDPVEAAALHDYGPLIVRQGRYSSSGVTLDDVQFSDSSANGGTRVTLKSLRLTERGGDTVSITVDGSCFDFTADGDQRHLCLDDDNVVGGFVTGITGARKSADDLTPAQRSAVKNLLAGSGSLGVVTVQRSGQWYVSPLRTTSELSVTLLSGLQDGDGKELIGLIGGK